MNKSAQKDDGSEEHTEILFRENVFSLEEWLEINYARLLERRYFAGRWAGSPWKRPSIGGVLHGRGVRAIWTLAT